MRFVEKSSWFTTPSKASFSITKRFHDVSNKQRDWLKCSRLLLSRKSPARPHGFPMLISGTHFSRYPVLRPVGASTFLNTFVSGDVLSLRKFPLTEPCEDDRGDDEHMD